MILEQWVSLWGDVRGGWLCGDGFAGIAHPIDRRYMFLHGDTFWREGGDTWATRNSVTIFDPEAKEIHAAGVTTSPFIPPDQQGEAWYWHGDMMWDGPDLWVMPTRVTATEGGWGFKNSPPRDLVQLSWPSFQDPVYVDRYPLPYGEHGIEWGASLVRAYGEAPWIYIYGSGHQDGWYGHDVFCARVRSGYMLDGSYWRFYAGMNASGAMKWSSDEDQAVPVIDHSEGPAGTFSSDVTFGGQFRITSKLHGDFGSQVTIWQAGSPVGPFATRSVVEVPWTSADQTYGAFAHPGLPPLANGRKLISVNHNTDAGLAAIMENPALYRPSWHEVLW